MSEIIVTWGTVLLGGLTGALAVATFWMARQTKKLAESATAEIGLIREANALSRDSVEVSRHALQASIRPILADVPSGTPVDAEVVFDDGSAHAVTDAADVVVSEKEHAILCSFPLRNVGSGLGLVVGLGLRFGDVGWSGKTSLALIPPGEMTRFAFTVPRNRPELREGIEQLLGGYLTGEVRYTDANGAQPLVTRVSVMRGDDGLFRVRQMFFLEPGASQPFAASGPSEGGSFG